MLNRLPWRVRRFSEEQPNPAMNRTFASELRSPASAGYCDRWVLSCLNQSYEISHVKNLSACPFHFGDL